MKIKAIMAYVFKNDVFNGCSNGGISERYDKLYVVCKDGYIDLDSDNLPENVVELKSRGKYRYAEPLVSVNKGCVGWMSGGALLYSSDSRFGGMPVSIHDRQETFAQYDLLSR